ncbi:amino acid ABC transporter ATP-binding protein [Micromonospora sp. NPDC005161]
MAYADHQVVHDVSMDVAQGEVISIIGPSGAGKSSFLRAINWLEPPAAGRLTFGDHVYHAKGEGGLAKKELRELRRDIGMVFQQFNLFPHLTALENVMLAQVHSLSRSKGEARARAIRELEHVGLKEFADRKPGRCSGGQQQRIAIARALAMDPQVMLFDEPTSALDPEYAMDVLTTMRRLADEGMTMLVVTHEMHFAADVADRVVFMAEGRIVEEGPARRVISDPQHERTQRFLAAVKGR